MKKKYSKEELINLNLNDYISLMCDELNKAGYKQKLKIDGEIEDFEYTADEYVLEGAIINNISALNYLKEIGILNNGKCPRCGGIMNNNDYTFSSYNSPNASFAICPKCHNEGVNFQKNNNPTKNEGCYIATACYGDYNCPEVLIFRSYRDNYLSHYAFGKLFIRIYYFISPSIAKGLKNRQIINKLIKSHILNPIYNKLKTKY